MKGILVSLVAAVVVAGLVSAGCTQAAPPPAPTAAPAAPAKAAEPAKPTAAPVQPTAAPAAPTKAPEATKPAAAPAPPTAVPAKKVTYPEKGKAISVIANFLAGGAVDTGARTLSAALEKELGTTVEVLNKPGAGGQVGAAEAALAKPDGYSIGYLTLSTLIALYLNPERKTTFNRGSFEPVAGHLINRGAVLVKADSPYKDLKDLVDAAKAKPGQIKASTTGLLGVAHLAILQLQKLTGAKFSIVHFDGDPPATPNLIGGHVDVGFGFLSSPLQYMRSGQVRALAILDKEPSAFAPEVKTAVSQGYKLDFLVEPSVFLPAGAPREAVDVLTAAVKKTTEDAEHQRRMNQVGLEVRYMSPAQFATYWNEAEALIKPLMAEALAGAK